MIEARTERQGIYNLGALCYMNSFMQMLYKVQVFSNSIFEVQENDPIIFELQR